MSVPESLKTASRSRGFPLLRKVLWKITGKANFLFLFPFSSRFSLRSFLSAPDSGDYGNDLFPGSGCFRFLLCGETLLPGGVSGTIKSYSRETALQSFRREKYGEKEGEKETLHPVPGFFPSPLLHEGTSERYFRRKGGTLSPDWLSQSGTGCCSASAFSVGEICLGAEGG